MLKSTIPIPTTAAVLSFGSTEFKQSLLVRALALGRYSASSYSIELIILRLTVRSPSSQGDSSTCLFVRTQIKFEG